MPHPRSASLPARAQASQETTSKTASAQQRSADQARWLFLILARFSTSGGGERCNRARTGRAKRGTAGAWRQQARDSARAPVRAHCSLISKVQFSVSSLLQLFFFQNFFKIFVKFNFKNFNFSKISIYFLILQNLISNFARNLRGAGAIC